MTLVSPVKAGSRVRPSAGRRLASNTRKQKPVPVVAGQIAPAQACAKARILVVEDHPFVREGVVRLINGQPDLVCCGETGSIAATPGAVGAKEPNLVLLDLKLRDGEAFPLIASLRLRFPAVAILILSQYDEQSYAPRALHNGAHGYIMKEAASEELLNAIRVVLSGRIYLSPAMAARSLSAPGSGPLSPGSRKSTADGIR